MIPIVPDIVAEVLSPSERPGRIHRKLNHYFQAGVKEVWLADPESREGEIWTGTNLPVEQLTGSAAVTSSLLPGFALPLEELFS